MNYFFASDVHLGLQYGKTDASEREKVFVGWLDMVEKELTGDNGVSAPVSGNPVQIGDTGEPLIPWNKNGALFLIGDLFDFWYEYKRVVPKGFVRVLGKLAQMSDRGIEIHLFTGNHDVWMFDYFEKELGVRVHDKPRTFLLNGKLFYIMHGHGAGVKDRKLLLMHAVFHSKTAQFLFSRLVHPDFAMRFGHNWSLHNRRSRHISHEFKGEKEPVVSFAREYLNTHIHPVDYFVAGHLHTPVEYPLNGRSTLIVLGEWIERPVYGVFDGSFFSLKAFSKS